MKIKPIHGLTAISLAIASCVPTPTSGNNPSTSGSEVPAPQIQDLSKIPVGRPDPTGRANMVISPYRPYNIIDVKGYRSGEIVGDPSTGKANPSTGQLDSRTAKFFRVP